MDKQKVYFENIQNVIIDNLELANSSVFIAVAWFTDIKLIRVLEKISRRDIKINILLFDDKKIDKTIYSLLDKKNIKIYFSTKLMHNKFCIIDKTIIMSGSYNWTNNARKNDENIVLLHNNELALEYIIEFERLKTKAYTLQLYLNLNRERFYENLESLKDHIWEKHHVNSYPIMIKEDNLFNNAKPNVIRLMGLYSGHFNLKNSFYIFYNEYHYLLYLYLIARIKNYEPVDNLEVRGLENFDYEKFKEVERVDLLLLEGGINFINNRFILSEINYGFRCDTQDDKFELGNLFKIGADFSISEIYSVKKLKSLNVYLVEEFKVIKSFFFVKNNKLLSQEISGKYLGNCLDQLIFSKEITNYYFEYIIYNMENNTLSTCYGSYLSINKSSFIITEYPMFKFLNSPDSGIIFLGQEKNMGKDYLFDKTNTLKCEKDVQIGEFKPFYINDNLNTISLMRYLIENIKTIDLIITYDIIVKLTQLKNISFEIEIKKLERTSRTYSHTKRIEALKKAEKIKKDEALQADLEGCSHVLIFIVIVAVIGFIYNFLND